MKILYAVSCFLPAAILLSAATERQPAPASPSIRWVHLSSKNGDLPVPGESQQQTAAVVADLDKDGVDDFILGFRQKPPAVQWYRRSENGWTKYVVEPEYLTVEAGGAAYDIDGDGDLDIVFGGDSRSDELWWWENPYPNYDPGVPWRRRAIKKEGARQHHDQIFGDFLGKGKPQLVFWNQGAKTIFLAEIPPNPRETEPWTYAAIFSGQAGAGIRQAALYPEGLASHDIDGDGRMDLLAGNFWFKHQGGMQFKPVQVGEIGGRVAAGKFKPGRYAQIVIAPGDGTGPLRWYECKGNPEDPRSWVGHDLLSTDVIHGHSLDLGDIDGDGHLDIFCAEMAKWTERSDTPDRPDAKAWLLYGDGRGSFRKVELVTGHGFHEARLGDLDGDGDLDILNKPYNWEAPRIDVWLNNGTGPRKTKSGRS